MFRSMLLCSEDILTPALMDVSQIEKKSRSNGPFSFQTGTTTAQMLRIVSANVSPMVSRPSPTQRTRA